MAITFNASTTSGLGITSDNSGAIAFQKNGTNSLVLPTSGTVTIASQTGTLNAAGPAFSAYQSVAQSALGSNTYTKLQLQTEDFDTNNCFDNTTNYRFTPTVAGYYILCGGFRANGTTTGNLAVLYKNGTFEKNGTFVNSSAGTPISTVNTVLYLNGSTDYVELYGLTAVSLASSTGKDNTYFNGCLLRGA